MITKLPNILRRGIGIHHGGLIPIVKEVIELLFQEGLIKEKKARVTNEKKVISEIKQESKNMQDDIANEHKMRQERMQDLDDQMTQDTDLTNRFLNNFGPTLDQIGADFGPTWGPLWADFGPTLIQLGADSG